MAAAQAPPSDSATTRLEELSGSDVEEELIGAAMSDHLEYLQLVTPPLRDMLETDTSNAQDDTLEAILPFLEGNPNEFDLNSHSIPKLQRRKHVAFLHNMLGSYPPQMAMMDAARPWFLYWSLQGLTALGEDVSDYQERVVYTFSAAQHPMGGFGGGHGQLPHLAATYAAILSLVIVGGQQAYDSVNRKTMWEYLGNMKQADGGFTMSPGGEEDIRGAFCAMVTLSLLNLPLDLPRNAPARANGFTSFMDGLGEWISRCQNYEGGISAAPGNEAHGAYAFCGLGCLSIMGSPTETMNKYLDMPLLIHWLSSRQCAPEGGFCGRTNKLVDGCYSHWIGSCWALVEAASGKTGLWNRSALGRYILAAAQFKRGGLVDKPGKRPDAYHTCYNLAGLSATQHVYSFDQTMQGTVGKGALGAPYHWKVNGVFEEGKVWDEGDMAKKVHPVFIVPWGKAEECRSYFEGKGSP